MPKMYTTVSGDMWDYIALKTMGSEKYMDKLLAANMKYREVSVFSAGIELTIPEIEKAAKLTSLPPWRR